MARSEGSTNTTSRSAENEPMQRVTGIEATAPSIINPQDNVIATTTLPRNSQRRLSTKKVRKPFHKKHLVSKKARQLKSGICK